MAHWNMPMDDRQEALNAEATELLSAVTAGNRDGMDRLFGLVYEKLRDMAQHQLAKESSAHTLSPTALAHEAYLKLIDHDQMDIQGRTHFIALAATAMRRLLVDHARTKQRVKRGGGRTPSEFDDQIAVFEEEKTVDVLTLEEALKKLVEKSERVAKVAELRLFGGLQIDEIAEALGVSSGTIDNDWAAARAWLKRELTDKP